MKSFSRPLRVIRISHPSLGLATFLASSALAAPGPTTVVGWGWNNHGQASPPGGLTNIVGISAAGAASVALRANGTVFNWGFPYEPGMPPGLSDVTAIDSGRSHMLALRSNGTVVAWGENESGQTSVPAGLSNVVAISGGGGHSLALKADGTVVGWGANNVGQISVPAGLSNVIAVSASMGGNGNAWSLALRSDGTVVGWGDNSLLQTTVPAGLSNVVAIAASAFLHSVALKSDGTVVAWGIDRLATNVPRGLSNVVAISAGSGFTLALRADGSIVAWGDNSNGETTVPASARNATAIAAGWFHGVAVTRATPPPWPRIIQPPLGIIVVTGDNVLFQVVAASAAPLTYRWQHRGRNLPNETNEFLFLRSVEFRDAGDYAAIVSADGLSVRSAPAFLAVSNRPVAFPQIAEGVEDTEVIITLEATDPSNLLLTGTVVALPSSGRLYQFDDGLRGAPIERVPALLAGDTVLYVPAPDGNGLPYDSFRFTVRNAIGASLPANVEINLRPVNDAPSFTIGPDLDLDEDAGPQSVSGWAAAIRAGPLNESGQALSFLLTNDAGALFSSPPALDVNGLLSFTPAPDANGSATVTVLLQDDGGTAGDGQDMSAPQTFRITIRPVNDAPIARPQIVSLDEDVAMPITLAASDVEGDALTYRVTPPLHGILSGVAPNLLYRPSPNYFGPDRFTFTVNDGQADSAATAVNLQIAPVNDPPAAGVELSSPMRLTFTGSSNLVLLAPDNSRGVIIGDATSSTDIENDPLEFSWFRDGETAPFAPGLRVTNVFEVGPHTIILHAFDGQAESEASQTFEVLTPGEALEALVAQVDQAPLERNRKRPLIASLKVATASFERGEFSAGANQLRAFQNKIRAQLSAAEPSLAEALSEAAGEILRALVSK